MSHFSSDDPFDPDLIFSELEALDLEFQVLHPRKTAVEALQDGWVEAAYQGLVEETYLEEWSQEASRLISKHPTGFHLNRLAMELTHFFQRENWPLKHWLAESIILGDDTTAIGLLNQFEILKTSSNISPSAPHEAEELGTTLSSGAPTTWADAASSIHQLGSDTEAHSEAVFFEKDLPFSKPFLELHLLLSIIFQRPTVLKKLLGWVDIEQNLTSPVSIYPSKNNRSSGQDWNYPSVHCPLVMSCCKAASETSEMTSNRLACVDLLIEASLRSLKSHDLQASSEPIKSESSHPLKPLNFMDASRLTPLMMAAKTGCLSSVIKLIPHSRLEQRSFAFESALHPVRHSFSYANAFHDVNHCNALAISIIQGHTAIFKELLSHMGPEATHQTFRRTIHLAQGEDAMEALLTPLMLALHHRQLEISQLLIPTSNLHFHSKKGVTPLQIALTWGQMDLVSELLKKPNLLNPEPSSSLLYAYEEQRRYTSSAGQSIRVLNEHTQHPISLILNALPDPQAALLLRSQLPELDASTVVGGFLSQALNLGAFESAKVILESGHPLWPTATSSIRLTDEENPLWTAITLNQMNWVRTLTPQIDPFERSKNSGLNAFELAGSQDRLDIALDLIHHYPDFKASLSDPYFSQILARCKSHACITHWAGDLCLGQQDSYTPRVTQENMPPLLISLMLQDTRAIQAMLPHHPDRHSLYNPSRMAFTMACLTENWEHTELLWRQGLADFKACNDQGQTALLSFVIHLATKADGSWSPNAHRSEQSIEILKLLLIHSDWEQRTPYGSTAFDYLDRLDASFLNKTLNDPHFMSEVESHREKIDLDLLTQSVMASTSTTGLELPEPSQPSGHSRGLRL